LLRHASREHQHVSQIAGPPGESGCARTGRCTYLELVLVAVAVSIVFRLRKRRLRIHRSTLLLDQEPDELCVTLLGLRTPLLRVGQSCSHPRQAWGLARHTAHRGPARTRGGVMPTPSRRSDTTMGAVILRSYIKNSHVSLHIRRSDPISRVWDDSPIAASAQSHAAGSHRGMRNSPGQHTISSAVENERAAYAGAVPLPRASHPWRAARPEPRRCLPPPRTPRSSLQTTSAARSCPVSGQ
jgi:hypothetical protein